MPLGLATQCEPQNASTLLVHPLAVTSDELLSQGSHSGQLVLPFPGLRWVELAESHPR